MASLSAVNKAGPRPFVIRDDWAALLWRPALPAAAVFGAAFLFILPMALPAAPRLALALLLGAACAWAFVVWVKLGHLRRHCAEAEFLGFNCRVSRGLYNPFSGTELLLDKEAGDPEEDRLLAELVRIHGPAYLPSPPAFGFLGSAAGPVAVLLVLAAKPLRAYLPALLPLFGLAILAFLVDAAERLFSRIGRNLSFGEGFGYLQSEAGYKRWNFLALESQRRRAGRVEAMRRDVSRVLLSEAALPGGAAVLELGAGSGFLWTLLPQELKQNWAQAEKDPLAALYASRHGRAGNYLRAEIGKLTFPDASFEAITGLEVFDSLTQGDLEAALREAWRLLRPGGRLVHLKDFSDWPGQPLAEKMNQFAMRAIRREPVSANKLAFRYERLEKEEAAALRDAVGAEAAPVRRFARVLADIYETGPDSKPEYRVPMLVSCLALRLAFEEAGFKVSPGHCGRAPWAGAALARVIAEKPS